MEAIWILVADTSKARIFSATSPISDFEEVQLIEHPEARLHQQDLKTDKHGSTPDGAVNSSSHGMDSAVNPKEQEAIEFAKQVSGVLEQANNASKYERLVVVAAPAFLGLLREHFPTPVTKKVSREIDKNLTQFRVDEIRSHLPERI